MPTRDHLWANRGVRLENQQQQEKYISITFRFLGFNNHSFCSSFRSYWERYEKQLKTRHWFSTDLLSLRNLLIQWKLWTCNGLLCKRNGFNAEYGDISEGGFKFVMWASGPANLWTLALTVFMRVQHWYKPAAVSHYIYYSSSFQIRKIFLYTTTD